MALAYTKTWSFTKYLYAYESDLTLMQKHWYFGLKSVLIDLGWEVRGGLSPDIGLVHNTAEAYGAFSGADPWPTVAHPYKTSGSDVYIIMRAPCGLEICFGANYGTFNTYVYQMFFYVSHAAGFGAANGGANGTSGGSAVPPTATDQQVIYTHNASTDTTGIDNGSTFSIYGMKSSDDLHNRVVIKRLRGVNLWLSLEHLTNPHANLDNGGRVFSFRAASGDEQVNSVMDNDYYTTAIYYGRVAGINRALYAGTNGYANLGHQSLNIVQADNKMVVAPIDLYNNTLGEKGYYGTVPDLYWGNNNQFFQLLGDSIGGAPKWFSGGSIVSPWDSVTPEPPPRVY